MRKQHHGHLATGQARVVDSAAAGADGRKHDRSPRIGGRMKPNRFKLCAGLFCASLLCASLLLVPSAQALTRTAATLTQDVSPAVQARISRVEHGLSSRIVVKGAANQKMSLTERMAFHRVPAVSIALINNGRIEWTRAYGVLDANGRQAATPTTLFQAASVSKTVSAMGALRLVEQDKLSLDATANEQLSAWKIPQNELTRKTPVSLRMLLNHSAGMSGHGFYGYDSTQKIPTLLQVLDGAAPATSAPVRVDTLPGTVWRYSGGGYCVVELMMTEAGRQPFPDLMRTLVLDPLGMTHSTFAQTLPPSWQAQAASAHDGEGKAVAGRWHVYPESAAAGLWTTPTDLAQVVLAIQQAQAGQPGKVLSGDAAASMLRRGLGEYGLGLYTEKLSGTTSFAHSGGNHGFRAQLYGYTGTGQGVVVLTNSDNGAALIEEILTSVAAEYDWPEFRVVEKSTIAADAAVNASLAGDYQLLDQPAHVVAEGDRLYFQSDLFGKQRMELFAESRARFFMTAQDMAVDFERAGNGEVIGFSLIRGAGTYPGTKKK